QFELDGGADDRDAAGQHGTPVEGEVLAVQFRPRQGRAAQLLPVAAVDRAEVGGVEADGATGAVHRQRAVQGPLRAAVVGEAAADEDDVRVALDVEEVGGPRSEEHTSELQSRENLVCRLLLEKK